MKIPVFEGIISVITTPFGADVAINYDVLGRHIEFLIGNGVHAILPEGTTGEYYALSNQERHDVLRFVADKVAGRVPIYAGTNSARPADTIELSNFARSLGYEAVLLAAPFYAVPDRDELVAHFRNIAASTDLPIILYNFPARTGVDMDKAFLEGLADIEAICAIKESSGSIGRIYQHMLLFPHLQRICGFDDQALDHFLWGSRSWIAGASNFLPAEHVALYETALVKQDWTGARDLMTVMMPLIYLLENGGKYIQYVKYGCELAGLPVGDVRPPLGPLTETEKQTFAGLYKQLKAATSGRDAA